VVQFRRTDFDHPFSDDPAVRRAGAVEVEAARDAFEACAERSSDHAELASMAWERTTDSRKPPSHVAPADRRLHVGDMDLALRDPSDRLGPVTEDLRTLARYRAEMPEDALRAGMQREIARLRAEGASRALISERGLEIEDGVRQVYAERRHLEASAPDLAAALRQAGDGRVDLTSDTAQRRFVEQINERLTPDERADLRAGDAEALHRITRDPRTQLELARAYLEVDKVHSNDAAMDRVLDRIADQRHGDELHAPTDGDRGMRHG
jgi:type IV secretion system T-DNA border endonuclease VirD2